MNQRKPENSFDNNLLVYLSYKLNVSTKGLQSVANMKKDSNFGSVQFSSRYSHFDILLNLQSISLSYKTIKKK